MAFALPKEEEATKLSSSGQTEINAGTKRTTSKGKLFSLTQKERVLKMSKRKKNASISKAWSKTKKK
jgi:hypothetical protein